MSDACGYGTQGGWILTDAQNRLRPRPPPFFAPACIFLFISARRRSASASSSASSAALSFFFLRFGLSACDGSRGSCVDERTCDDRSLVGTSLEGTPASLLGAAAGGLLGGIVTSVMSGPYLLCAAGSLGLPGREEEDTSAELYGRLYGVGDIGGWFACAWLAEGRTGVTGRGVASGDLVRAGECRRGVGVAGARKGLPGAALVCLLCVDTRDAWLVGGGAPTIRRHARTTPGSDAIVLTAAAGSPVTCHQLRSAL